jgi:hypothetical protein
MNQAIKVEKPLTINKHLVLSIRVKFRPPDREKSRIAD